MNFEDYERRCEAAYGEFAAVVRDILVKAIAAADGVSPPQSIQCRAKDAGRLKPKLQDREKDKDLTASFQAYVQYLELPETAERTGYLRC